MTPVIPLVYALDFQLDRIFKEGLENRFARHAAMSQKVYDWSLAHGMPSFAEDGSRSKTVATILNTMNLDVSALNKFLLEHYQMRISGGYGDLKDKTFRIATMGEISLSDVDRLLEGMEKFISLGK
jgi:aspartate aminotransferase-like enzyme